MKLDKDDIKFLETYDNIEFYFESGILNYFVQKYGIVGVLDRGNRYLGSYEYSLILDNLTINFSATLDYDLLQGEDCLKVDSYGFEVFDNIENELVNLEVIMSLDNKSVRESFRATELEDQELLKAAKNMNMKKSEYIRYKLFDEKNIIVPSISDCQGSIDIERVLHKLKDKYMIQRNNSRDVMEGHKINDKINSLDQIVKDLSLFDLI